MKIYIDTDEKSIEVVDDIKIPELVETIKLIFPKDWNTYTIKPTSTKEYFHWKYWVMPPTGTSDTL